MSLSNYMSNNVGFYWLAFGSILQKLFAEKDLLKCEISSSRKSHLKIIALTHNRVIMHSSRRMAHIITPCTQEQQ